MKKKPNQGRAKSQPVGDDTSRGQIPKNSMFGLEAPVAGAVVNMLGKAGIQLGAYALTYLSQEGPFKVCVLDSRFVAEHHVVALLVMNCSPHGMYIEKIDVDYTTNKPLKGISLRTQEEQERLNFGFGEEEDFPTGFLEKVPTPCLLPAGQSKQITLVIPRVDGKNAKEQNWAQAIFSLTHLKDGKQEDVKQNFALRW